MNIRRNSGSINWRLVQGEGLSADAANALIKDNNIVVKPILDHYYAPTRFCDYDTELGLVAYLRNGENVLTLYYLERVSQIKGKRCLGYEYIPKKYSIKLNGDDESAATGKTAFEYVNQEFKKRYNKTIRAAFGLSPECLDCIPAPLNYGKINPEPYTNFYKIDVSSAYSTEACKKLPTMKGSKTLVGRHEPNEYYPFAFYPKEGKLAIYGESKYLYDIPLNPAYTLLCPACPYSFEPILKEVYEKKETAQGFDRQYYKDILNYFVGWLHWRPKNQLTGKYAEPGDDNYNPNCPRYAAAAAVIKARCNARMLELKEEIEKFGGNEVVLINTDSVGWTGHDMPHLYTTEKGLGNLILEHKNSTAIILGSKRYQIKDKNGRLVTKWSGVRKDITEKMAWCDIYNAGRKPRYRVWDWQQQQIIYKYKEDLSCEKEI